jgi:hypothetical protein
MNRKSGLVTNYRHFYEISSPQGIKITMVKFRVISSKSGVYKPGT